MPIIKPLIRMLEAHRLRTAQLAIESAQKKAVRTRKLLEIDGAAQAPEKDAALQQLVESAEKLAAHPPVPTSGPIFASKTGTALNMNNLLNRQILPALRKAKLEWHGFHA